VFNSSRACEGRGGNGNPEEQFQVSGSQFWLAADRIDSLETGNKKLETGVSRMQIKEEVHWLPSP
jgi:hypothetical protein